MRVVHAAGVEQQAGAHATAIHWHGVGPVRGTRCFMALSDVSEVPLLTELRGRYKSEVAELHSSS